MMALGERSLRLLEPLRYGDLFEYPLTAAEVRRFCCIPISLEATRDALRSDPELTERIEEKEGLFFLRGRSQLVTLRRRRAAHSQALLERSRRLIQRVAELPFVRGVAITGSLAVENADRGGDVDLMILTAPDRLWVVHLPVRLFELWTRRFRLCANYYLTTRRFELPERNLFVAREILQMRPVAGSVWQRFYASNSWVYDFFPNWEGPRLDQLAQPRRHPARYESLLSGALGDCLDRIAHRVVRWRLERNPRLRGADWIDRGVILEPDRYMLHMALYHRLLPSIYEPPPTRPHA